MLGNHLEILLEARYCVRDAGKVERDALFATTRPRSGTPRKRTANGSADRMSADRPTRSETVNTHINRGVRDRLAQVARKPVIARSKEFLYALKERIGCRCGRSSVAYRATVGGESHLVWVLSGILVYMNERFDGGWGEIGGVLFLVLVFALALYH